MRAVADRAYSYISGEIAVKTYIGIILSDMKAEAYAQELHGSD